MSKTSDYWRKQQEEWDREYHKNEKKWDSEIQKIYKQLQQDMQAEIDGWFSRFADAEGLTMAEARQAISKADMDYYARRAKELVKLAQLDFKDGTSTRAVDYFSDQTNQDMRIYNAAMKINRMQLLQSMLDLEIDRASGQVDETMHQALTEQAERTYRDQAKILGSTVIQNMERIPEIVNASFHGATFSERIWGPHQDKLKADIQTILARGLILGESPDRFRKLIVSQSNLKTKAAYKAARTLLNTEFARVQITAQLTSIQEAGFEQFEYITAAGCCPACQALDGKKFSVHGSEAGDNVPPMHPNCLCTIAAYSDRNEYEKWLDGYSEHGLDYEEWKTRQEKSNITEHRVIITSRQIRESYSTQIGKQALSASDPAKMSKIKFANSCDPIFEYHKNVPELLGYDDVVIHGDPYGFVIKDADLQERTNVTVRELAEMLVELGTLKQDRIRLCACNAGHEDGFAAQALANLINKPVLAPTRTLFVYPDGKMLIAGEDENGDPDLNDKGEWKLFTPKE